MKRIELKKKEKKAEKKEGFNPDSTVLIKHHPLFCICRRRQRRFPPQPTESQIRISDRQKKEEKEEKQKKHAGKFGNKGRMPVAVNRTCRELQAPNKREVGGCDSDSQQHCSKTQGEASRCRNWIVTDLFGVAQQQLKCRTERED